MSTSAGTPIAYVLTQHPRTTQTFVDAEIRALRAAGHPVTVFALNEPGREQVRTAADRAEVAATVYLKAQGPFGLLAAVWRALVAGPAGFAIVVLRALRSGGWDARRVLWRLFHLAEATVVWDRCRDQGIDVVHAHFGQSTSTVGWLATALGRSLAAGPTQLVVTVHCGTEVEDTAETIPATKVRDARAVVAVSDHTRSQLMRHVPREHWDTIRVIRCGIDLEAFEIQPPRPPPDVPTVVFVGRLDTVKGVPVLLEAARRVRQRGCPLRLEIIGGGPLGGELRHEADASWVHFAGELPPDQVRQRLRGADAFCLPSFDEGIPVSIMEAMAMGVPVVTTAIAGVPELAVDQHTALVVPAGNVEVLAGALQRILSDRALVDRMRVEARRRVEARHDASANLPELVELLAGSS
jgi:colanic acid/amylovoran biosynthesis glycosyltransferase